MNPETSITPTLVPEQKVIKSSPSHLLVLFLVILGVAVLSVIGTYYYLLPQLQYNQKYNIYPSNDQSNTNTDNIQQVTPVSGTTQDIEGWKAYTNTTYGFSFQYPASDLSIKDYGKDDATHTYIVDHIEGIPTIFKSDKQNNMPGPGGPSWMSLMVSTETSVQALARIEKEITTTGTNGEFTVKEKTEEVIGKNTWSKLVADHYIQPTSEHALSYYYVITNNDKTYIVIFPYGNDNTHTVVPSNPYKQFLSTFTFTDQTAQANTTSDTIAHNLIDAWLNNSKSSSTPTEKRITDYTFTISNISLNGDMLRFQVDYSVKPVNINQTDWAAGNGQIDTAAGWIYHKTSFVLATNVNGVYTITKMATSPL